MEKKNTAGRKTLTEAKLRKLARLEAGFDELLRDGADIPDYMPPRRKLAAAPEDLLAALDNAAPMPFEELETKWVSPLLCGFGVFSICLRNRIGRIRMRCAIRRWHGIRNTRACPANRRSPPASGKTCC